MNIIAYTYDFMPHLVETYIRREVGIEALIDFDLWMQLFPIPPAESRHDEINWRQFKWNAFLLQDDTLLLTYELPNPRVAREPKFIGIRIDRKTRDVRYYVLERAVYYDEPWLIRQIDYTSGNTNGKYPLKFAFAIDGTWSLRNFVLTIQKHPLIEERLSWSEQLKEMLSAAKSQQPG